MVAAGTSASQEPAEGAFRGAEAEASTLSLTLTRDALGALDAHLQSGAARGLSFEQPLLEALRASGACAPPGPCGDARRRALAPRTLRKVHEFIDGHLTDDFSVDDIAQAVFLSPFHLGRSYHQATGESLWQHVLRKRAALARALIAAQPHATLSDIAGQCGFESYGQFIAAFRKAYGLTPGGYRRLAQQ